MRTLLVTDIDTRWAQFASAADAARLAQISADELETVLEEHGICETSRYTIVEIIEDGNEQANHY